MHDEIKMHLETLNKMNNSEKLEYSFKEFYNSYNKNPFLMDCFFLIISNLVSNYPLSLDIDKLKDISDDDKKIIIDCTYKYIYETNYSFRGPLLNIFGEILDSNEPYITPYIDLIKMLNYNKYTKKR